MEQLLELWDPMKPFSEITCFTQSYGIQKEMIHIIASFNS